MTNGKALARWCKAQIGTSYDVMDCIKLIVNGIRKAEGADGESLTYTCGGTNELWRSINKSGKYQYVTEIVTIDEAKKRGMLVPGRLMVIWEAGHNDKYNDELGDCSHIGLYVGDADCEAVHSSYTRGQVASTTVKNGFTHVLTHRLIDLDGSQTGSTAPEATPAQPDVQEPDVTDEESIKPVEMLVVTEKDPINVRSAASIKASVIGHVARGSTVTAVGVPRTITENGVTRQWVEITFRQADRRRTRRGYACADYLIPILGTSTTPDTSATSYDMDDVVLPRSVVLALADAVNEAAVFLDNTSTAAVRLLLTAARDVTAYLEGDD